MRVYLAQINPIIAHIRYNAEKIIEAITRAKKLQAHLILLPELAITGYPPDDFLLMPSFLKAVEEALKEIASHCQGITAVVGTPRYNDTGVGKPLYNSAAVMRDGLIAGYSDKMLLPTYDVFDERRYFEPGVWRGYWKVASEAVAITLCEDIWRASGLITLDRYVVDPMEAIYAEPRPPQLLLNLSASPFSIENPSRRLKAAKKTAKSLQSSVILCNQVGGNDNLIFDGASFFLNSRGQLVCQAESFKEEGLLVDTSKQEALVGQPVRQEVEVLHEALLLGIRDYFSKQNFTKACVGLSGGIDSAVVAVLAKEALGEQNVLGLMMPSRYSSKASLSDAYRLADKLGIKTKEISIEPLFKEYLSLLAPHFTGMADDTTEENIQARIRATLLMAFSNKLGYILLSTGNKSELAVGYCTLYGDLCGGLAVINDLTKRKVYTLACHLNRFKEVIPQSIIDKEPSAELRYNQRDSDTLPPYDTLDTIVEEYLEKHKSADEIANLHNYELELVKKIIKAIHRNEYKRRQSPPGLRVTDKAFSIGRRFPIVERWI